MIAEARREWASEPLHEATRWLRQLMLMRIELERVQSARLGTNPTGYRLLGALLGQGPLTPTDIARHLDLAPSATSNAIERLEAAGLVERARDMADRRRVVVRTTSRAERLATDLLVPLFEHADRVARELPPPDQLAVVDYLRSTVEAVQDQLHRLDDTQEGPRP